MCNIKQCPLPGMSINSSLQGINDNFNKKPVEIVDIVKRRRRRCCLNCRYCCFCVYGTNWICSFANELTVTDGVCDDYERDTGSNSILSSEEVIQHLTMKYWAEAMTFVGALQEVAENSGYLVGDYKEVGAE